MLAQVPSGSVVLHTAYLTLTSAKWVLAYARWSQISFLASFMLCFMRAHAPFRFIVLRPEAWEVWTSSELDSEIRSWIVYRLLQG